MKPTLKSKLEYKGDLFNFDDDLFGDLFEKIKDGDIKYDKDDNGYERTKHLIDSINGYQRCIIGIMVMSVCVIFFIVRAVKKKDALFTQYILLPISIGILVVLLTFFSCYYIDVLNKKKYKYYIPSPDPDKQYELIKGTKKTDYREHNKLMFIPIIIGIIFIIVDIGVPVWIYNKQN